MKLGSAVLALAVVLSTGSARAEDVRGTVTFTGAAPKLAPLAVTKDQSACGATQPDESVALADGKLANVVVVVKGAPAAPKAAVLDQQRCKYVPHVLTASAGTTLDILNSDPVLHNSHAYLGQASAFNVAMPLRNQKVTKKLDKPGPLKVKCDVHPWMSAYVFVADGPAAVTGADGRFTIGGVPPGTYTVTAWHERFGEKTAQVTVPVSGAGSVEFAFGG
jgi:plastocyanin